MSESSIAFEDANAYERMMGRWSRAAGASFLDWLAPKEGADWLDVGCGTGAFTQLILDTGKPRAVTGIDPSSAQIAYIGKLPIAGRAEFKIADAMALPFVERSFDIVTSALVINFVPDQVKGVREMGRVARLRGMVAGYVWDFSGMRSPAWPLAHGLLAVGATPPVVVGTSSSSLDALQTIFTAAELSEVATTAIVVTNRYRDFDEYWSAATPPFLPVVKAIAALPQRDQTRLREAVRGFVATGAQGEVAFSARAHAVKGRVAG